MCTILPGTSGTLTITLICIRRWADQNYVKIIIFPDLTYPRCNNYLDIAITLSFSYPYIIQTVNCWSSDHLPVVLRYSSQLYEIPHRLFPPGSRIISSRLRRRKLRPSFLSPSRKQNMLSVCLDTS